jgi:hypothetical protein
MASQPVTVEQVRAAAGAYLRAKGDALDNHTPYSSNLEDRYLELLQLANLAGLPEPPPPEVPRWHDFFQGMQRWLARIEGRLGAARPLLPAPPQPGETPRAADIPPASPPKSATGEGEGRPGREAAPTPEDEPGAATKGPSQPETPPVNTLELDGGIWRVGYGDGREKGSFKDQAGSVFRDLARLFAEPNRRFLAQEFFPPPPTDNWKPPVKGAMAMLPHMGRDAGSDDQAMEALEKEIRQVAKDIVEADEAHDTETSARLHEKLSRLEAHYKTEGGHKQGHRGRRSRCGTLPPGKKANQDLRVKFDKLRKRLQEKGLPKLAAHLDEYLDNSGGKWCYAPPPDTSAWRVTCPAHFSEK